MMKKTMYKVHMVEGYFTYIDQDGLDALDCMDCTCNPLLPIILFKRLSNPDNAKEYYTPLGFQHININYIIKILKFSDNATIKGEIDSGRL